MLNRNWFFILLFSDIILSLLISITIINIIIIYFWIKIPLCTCFNVLIKIFWVKFSFILLGFSFVVFILFCLFCLLFILYACKSQYDVIFDWIPCTIILLYIALNAGSCLSMEGVVENFNNRVASNVLLCTDGICSA